MQTQTASRQLQQCSCPGRSSSQRRCPRSNCAIRACVFSRTISFGLCCAIAVAAHALFATHHTRLSFGRFSSSRAARRLVCTISWRHMRAWTRRPIGIPLRRRFEHAHVRSLSRTECVCWFTEVNRAARLHTPFAFAVQFGRSLTRVVADRLYRVCTAYPQFAFEVA